MDQKRTAALVLIVMLSIIVVTPMAFTNLANANWAFSPMNPIIKFTSPVNTTYTTNDVFLNVTIVTYPSGWYESISQLDYSVDGCSNQRMTVVTRNQYYTVHGDIANLNCSINLYNLSEGNHTLTVRAAFNYHKVEDYSLLKTNSVTTAYLTIDAIPDNKPTPNPTNTPLENSQVSPSQLVILFLAVIAAVIVSISVYYLRIKH